jgi:hypothetical protein
MRRLTDLDGITDLAVEAAPAHLSPRFPEHQHLGLSVLKAAF